MQDFFAYFRESANELKQVTWPKQEELLQLTMLTVVVVLLSSVALGGLDFAFSAGYQWLLSL